MATVALFGGSFDPPHFAHVNCIRMLLRSGLVEQVWVVPAALHKEKQLSAGVQARREMLELLMRHEFANEPRVKLETAQLQNPQSISTTLQLLEELQSRHPKLDFYVVIGSDLLPDLPRWQSAEKLREKAKFIVIPRRGASHDNACPQGYNLTHLELAAQDESDLSSKFVRSQIERKQSIEGLCPEYIVPYIQDHALYQR